MATTTALAIANIFANGSGIFGRSSSGVGGGDLLSSSTVRSMLGLADTDTPTFAGVTASTLRAGAVEVTQGTTAAGQASINNGNFDAFGINFHGNNKMQIGQWTSRSDGNRAGWLNVVRNGAK